MGFRELMKLFSGFHKGFIGFIGPGALRTSTAARVQALTVDDINPALPKDPKLWEPWYIP